MEIAVLIEQTAGLLTGLLNVAGATQQVSDMIAARVQSGRTTWTDEERAALHAQLASAKQYAADQINAQRAAGGLPPI